jgi:hypothetical protein
MLDLDRESVERLVRVEDGLTYLTKLMEAHVSKPCSDCLLQDDVSSLKNTQKWVRWFSKSAVGAAIIALVAVLIGH